MDSHIPPRSSCHQLFVLENSFEIIVELVEPKGDADGNQCDEDVTVIPAESLQRVHPLMRKLIRRLVSHCDNSQGRVEVRKACRENDGAGAVVPAKDSSPRRWWTWGCSRVAEDGCR